MPLFESYDRRIKQINEALAKYGIGSIEEAEQLCLSKGHQRSRNRERHPAHRV